MPFDVMRGFQVGQSIGGHSGLGAFVKEITARAQSLIQSQQDIAGKVQAEAAILPMKEASATRLLQEKARLFPPQPKALSGETAGRLSLSSQGERHAQRARQLLFPTGSADSFRRDLVARIHTPFGIGMLGSADAQSLEFNVMRAIDAQLRSETGATAPPAELKRLTDEFIANATSDPSAAFERLTSLEGGLRQTRTGIDPTGYYSQQSSPFEPTANEDLSSLSDEDILKEIGL